VLDISFGEILLICVVALVVLGPERLPAVARTLGALVARAQRFVASVKADIGQHTELASLVALKQEVQQTAAAFKDQLTAEVAEAQQTIHMAKLETAAAIKAATTIEADRVAADNVPPPAPADTEPLPSAAVAAEQAPMPPDVAAAALEPCSVDPDAQPAVQIDDNQLDLFADLPAASPSHESKQ
jgi:sec-independent protein translocase protein TatB